MPLFPFSIKIGVGIGIGVEIDIVPKHRVSPTTRPTLLPTRGLEFTPPWQGGGWFSRVFGCAQHITTSLSIPILSRSNAVDEKREERLLRSCKFSCRSPAKAPRWRSWRAPSGHQ